MTDLILKLVEWQSNLSKNTKALGNLIEVIGREVS